MREGLITDVISKFFSKEVFEEEVSRAKNIFWNNGEIDIEKLPVEERLKQEALFIFWFIFDFKLSNGKTPLKMYYLSRYLYLRESDKENYKNLLKSVYCLWRIEHVDSGVGVKLKNLINGKVFYVNEKSATHNLEVDDVVATRVSKIDDHYEIISPDNDLVFKNGLLNPLVGKILRHKKLNPKIVQDTIFAFNKDNIFDENFNLDDLKKKIINDEMCICDLCHKEGRIGGVGKNTETGEMAILCDKCQIKIDAWNNKISVKKQKKLTEDILKKTEFFSNIKLEQLSLEKNVDLSDVDNLNKALMAINMAWNGLSVKERKSFDKMTKSEMMKKFKDIKVDFKDF